MIPKNSTVLCKEVKNKKIENTTNNKILHADGRTKVEVVRERGSKEYIWA